MAACNNLLSCIQTKYSDNFSTKPLYELFLKLSKCKNSSLVSKVVDVGEPDGDDRVGDKLMRLIVLVGVESSK
jgi:hypothetical protein